jgi:hypothetical protein
MVIAGFLGFIVSTEFRGRAPALAS